jgi:hypothetical protein
MLFLSLVESFDQMSNRMVDRHSGGFLVSLPGRGRGGVLPARFPFIFNGNTENDVKTGSNEPPGNAPVARFHIPAENHIEEVPGRHMVILAVVITFALARTSNKPCTITNQFASTSNR